MAGDLLRRAAARYPVRSGRNARGRPRGGPAATRRADRRHPRSPGRSVTNLEEAAAARDVYLRTLNAMHAAGLEANVSLKLTQFGLDISYDQCRANLDQLVTCAAARGAFVRVDMESSAYTDRTLQLAGELHARHPNV